MHLLLFIANKFDFQLIVAVIFHNLWAAVTGEHQSCCTLMCLMMWLVSREGRTHHRSLKHISKTRRWPFAVLPGGWFKNYPGLAQKSKLEQRNEVSGEILLPCVNNSGQVHLLPHAMELQRTLSDHFAIKFNGLICHKLALCFRSKAPGFDGGVNPKQPSLSILCESFSFVQVN